MDTPILKAAIEVEDQTDLKIIKLLENVQNDSKKTRPEMKC